MTAPDAILALAEAGAALWIEDDRLRFWAPAGAITEELRAKVAACRPALVALVRAGGVLPLDRGAWPEPWRFEVEERAGIAEFEGGLRREDAEREAERLVRVAHARAFIQRSALVVNPGAGAVATARSGSGPHRRP
jgi:hypothetical protein